MKQKIQNLIGNAELESAIIAFKTYCFENNLADMFSVLVAKQAKFRTLRRERTLGLINSSEYSTELNCLTRAVLELLDQTFDNMYTTNITININSAVTDFTKWLDQVHIDDLATKLREAFSTETVLLEKVYTVMEPINKALLTKQIITPGTVNKAKSDLIDMFDKYQKDKQNTVNKQYLEDMNVIVSKLTDDPTEEIIRDCYDRLELYCITVGYNQSHTLRQVRSRVDTLNNRDSEVLRKFADRWQPVLNEHRTWIVDVCNRIIQRLG